MKCRLACPFIEGAITDSTNLDVSSLQNITSATVTLEVANGKTIVLHEGFYASEDEVNADEGENKVRFEGLYAEEVGISN